MLILLSIITVYYIMLTNYIIIIINIITIPLGPPLSEVVPVMYICIYIYIYIYRAPLTISLHSFI